MASRASLRWLWRDIRLVYVLLVWAAAAAGLFAYFGALDATPAKPTAPLAQIAKGADSGKANKIYIGSIVAVPPRGNSCWEMKIDNRTGRLWSNGYVACDRVAGAFADFMRVRSARSARLSAIGQAFRERK